VRQIVDHELRDAFDEVHWEISPEAARQADHLPQLHAEVLYYACREVLRNAARHARPAQSSQPLSLQVAARWQDGLEMLVMDNGVGFGGAQGDHAAGSGHGLALHSTMLAVIGGSLSVENAPGASTCIRLSLPAAG
jgi:signal transduction histidine kinase